MPKHVVTQNTGLTSDQASAKFREHFGQTYEIYDTKLIGADFILKKSGWTGIAFKVINKKDRAILRYNAMAPSFLVRFLFFGLITWVILYFVSWKPMQEEMASFIAECPEFK